MRVGCSSVDAEFPTTREVEAAGWYPDPRRYLQPYLPVKLVYTLKVVSVWGFWGGGAGW